MGILTDLAMGFGLKKPDDAYRERTAQNLESQGNQRGADQVRAQMTNNSDSNTSPTVSTNRVSGSNAPLTSLHPIPRPEGLGTDRVTWSPDIAPTRAQRNPARTADPYVEMTAAEEMLAKASNYLNPMNMVTKGAEYLGGVDRNNDKVVAVIGGKEVYRRADGTTYSYNALGLPYDTAGPDTLKEDPIQVSRREEMMFSMGQDNNEPTAEDMIPEDTIDPCPEGYVFDSDQQMCVIDPDTGFTAPEPVTAEPVTAASPYTPPPLSEYTQATNNFIPTPLTPTAPNPIEQQLRQMQQQLSGPRGQQRQPRSGLAGTTLNTGIMQARP